MPSSMSVKQRAEEAQRILDNTVFQEAIDNAVAAFHKSWESSKQEDTNIRELAYNRIKAIHDIKRELVKFVDAKHFIKE